MEDFGYSICELCDEEYVFMDGSRCARCLGLSQMPINNEDKEYETSSTALNSLLAA